MGTWWSTGNNTQLTTTPTKKLCDELIDNNADIVISISVFAANTSVDLIGLMNFLQRTHPVYSYTHNKKIILIYSPKNKPTRLRSNVSGEIISSITHEVTKYLINYRVCDPYSIEVSISLEDSNTSLKSLLDEIKENNYTGFMHGIDKLSAEKLKEQFN